MVDIISFVGILLSLLLIIFIRQENRSNIYLSGFFFIISLISLSRNTVFLSNKSYIYQFLNPYVYPLFYCSGPFLYLYVKKSFANDLEQALKPLEYLYFLPVILVFINFSPQYFLSSEDHAAYYREIKLNPLHLLNTKYLFFHQNGIKVPW